MRVRYFYTSRRASAARSTSIALHVHLSLLIVVRSDHHCFAAPSAPRIRRVSPPFTSPLPPTVFIVTASSPTDILLRAVVDARVWVGPYCHTSWILSHVDIRQPPVLKVDNAQTVVAEVDKFLPNPDLRAIEVSSIIDHSPAVRFAPEFSVSPRQIRCENAAAGDTESCGVVDVGIMSEASVNAHVSLRTVIVDGPCICRCSKTSNRKRGGLCAHSLLKPTNTSRASNDIHIANDPVSSSNSTEQWSFGLFSNAAVSQRM